nr:MAG TPA: hypothetical protein [Caudoviricetes sp.]
MRLFVMQNILLRIFHIYKNLSNSENSLNLHAV